MQLFLFPARKCEEFIFGNEMVSKKLENSPLTKYFIRKRTYLTLKKKLTQKINPSTGFWLKHKPLICNGRRFLANSFTVQLLRKCGPFAIFLMIINATENQVIFQTILVNLPKLVNNKQAVKSQCGKKLLGEPMLIK